MEEDNDGDDDDDLRAAILFSLSTGQPTSLQDVHVGSSGGTLSSESAAAAQHVSVSGSRSGTGSPRKRRREVADLFLGALSKRQAANLEAATPSACQVSAASITIVDLT